MEAQRRTTLIFAVFMAWIVLSVLIVLAVALRRRDLQEIPAYDAVPQFRLVDQDGHPRTRADLDGKVWIADFVFTHCAATCPAMTAHMRALQDGLEFHRNVRLVSISVDPLRDTPARLREYAAANGADTERWMFMTGEAAELRRLAVTGFKVGGEIASPADGPEGPLHSEKLVLVDARGTIRGWYDGADPERVRALAQDAARLAEEAAGR